jgi:hypothetical protein
MRMFWFALGSCALVHGLIVPPAYSAPQSHATTQPSAQSLVGTWHLVSIDYSGPTGTLSDPVFGPDPHGVIIYDRSGWMSVQIVTANRPTMTRPATRTAGETSPNDAQLKSKALDTYYAYFGTWEYDAATATITHHLKSSLLPYETGQDYRRQVEFHGTRLRLIVHSGEGDQARSRTLTWDRAP